jgi:RNA polymerase sigma-70 factor, ECF subfamily
MVISGLREKLSGLRCEGDLDLLKVVNGVKNLPVSENDSINMHADKSLEMQRMLHANTDRLLAYLKHKFPPDLRSFIEPQDVLQDTFFEAFQRINDFQPRGEDDSYRWLMAIARHRLLACLRMQRASKRGRIKIEEVDDVIAVLDELMVYSRTPSQSAMSHEIAAAIYASMSRIEPHYREVIQLRFINGLSIKQSAERMGRTEGAILMLCDRGLKALKVQLKSIALVN